MISKIQPYTPQNYYKPSFQAVVVKGAKIPVKYRGVNSHHSIGSKLLSNFKDMFFETFPKFDPEYKKLNL